MHTLWPCSTSHAYIPATFFGRCAWLHSSPRVAVRCPHDAQYFVCCPLCALLLQIKARVMVATGWPDNAATHLATAMITGVVSTTATNPVDVVKTFMFVGA